MEALRKRGDDIVGVRRVRGADDDGIQIGPERLEVGMKRRIRRARGGARRAGRLRIEDLRDAAGGDPSPIESVPLAGASEPDDTDTHYAVFRGRSRGSARVPATLP